MQKDNPYKSKAKVVVHPQENAEEVAKYGLDKIIIDHGYKKLSENTWAEHCENCISHPIDACGLLMPDATEFHNEIVFQKHIFKNNKKYIIEIARAKGINYVTWGRGISEYTIGFVTTTFSPIVVRRMFWQLMQRDKFPEFIEKCEFEIGNFILKDVALPNI